MVEYKMFLKFFGEQSKGLRINSIGIRIILPKEIFIVAVWDNMSQTIVIVLLNITQRQFISNFPYKILLFLCTNKPFKGFLAAAWVVFF